LFRALVFVLLLVAGWRKRSLVAGFLAGLGLGLVFSLRQILRRRCFAGHFLHWPFGYFFPGRLFYRTYAGTFVCINRSFLAVDFDGFAFEIFDRLRFIDDRNIVDDQIAGAETSAAKTVHANEHEE
jgi:hypothetical protein